jgi:hypothetical protein
MAVLLLSPKYVRYVYNNCDFPLFYTCCIVQINMKSGAPLFVPVFR